MRKQLLNIALLLTTAGTVCAQNYSGGSGTLADPYQIANKADLKYLSDSSSQWSFNFIQTADIIFTSADFASSGAFYYGGAGFSPIGGVVIGPTYGFGGTYNGNNHIINGLYINRPTQNYVGLFSMAYAAISNIGITNANIVGHDYVGGLAGQSGSSISNCYFSGSLNGNDYAGGLAGTGNVTLLVNCHSNGTVNGHNIVGGLTGAGGVIVNCYTNGSVNGNDDVGGLAGGGADISNSYNNSTVIGQNNIGGLMGANIMSQIKGCYNSGNVSGQSYVGGLTGYNNSIIMNSYNTGSVSGQSGIGGLVGSDNIGTSKCYSSGLVSGSAQVGALEGVANLPGDNNFWNTDVYPTDNSDIMNATGINTAQMQTQATFTAAGWDFVGESTNGTDGIWTMGTCNADGSSYPILTWQVFSGGGEGTVANPFTIATKQDLKNLSENGCFWGKNFIQTANITFTSADFVSGGAFYNGGQGYSPTGGFSGTYNGNNYSIDSLYINRPTQNNIGLIGYLNTAGTLNNIACTNVNIAGQYVVGGVAGNNDGTILNCHSTGTVNATGQMGGGLVGEHWGTMNNCYSSCSVIGHQLLGGLVGVNFGGIINTSYSNGYVTGATTSDVIGGLVGAQSSGTITNCYSSSSVSGQDKIGGLVGDNDGPITNSYCRGLVNGSSNVGGLVGSYHSGPISNSFWDTQTSGQLTSAGGGTGRTSLQLQTQSTFTGATWDFVGETTNGSADIWHMNCATNNGFPVFSWQTLNTATNLTATTSVTNVLCHSSNTGSATITVNNSTGPLTYTWVPSGGTSATASNLVAGAYTVTSIDPTGCTISQTLTITQPAAIDVSTQINNLTITANATGVNYQWIDCNNGNAAIAGETSQSFTATTNGNYAVVITSGACSDTSACVAITTTGIKNVSGKAGVSIYPNPISGMFTVAGFETGTKIEVVNVIGEVVYKSVTTDTKTNIDLSNESNGVYFIKTINGFTYKIVKQN